MLRLLLILSVVACSHSKNKAQDPGADERLEVLAEKFADKKASVSLLLDTETGWPSRSDCDGTLWAGKAKAVGLPVKLELAEYEPGQIHRRPPPSCWNKVDGDVGSKSTVSNDMILGYMWGLWNHKDLEAFKRLAKYGEDHNWVMGEPAAMAARVILKTNQQGLLGRIIYDLSNGTDVRSYRRLFEYYPEVKEDYEMHLQALGILLQGEVNMDVANEPGASLVDINDQMLQRLRDLVDADPKNPLFHAALGVYTGDFEKAITLLLDDTTPVPSYVRGDNPAALSGVEWLFAADVILRTYD